jgi:hypothetical protein
MLSLFKRFSRKREIYFHEDDYCQQQLLPQEAATHATSEIRKIDEFAEAHKAPDGLGWTDVYVRNDAPAQFRVLNLNRERFDALVSPHLPRFDQVFTGYSSHREACVKTAAWGLSQSCALFADWSEDGIVANVWTEFFDSEDASIDAAARAVAALASIHPLIYVDWAWGYTCEAASRDRFASMLKTKLEAIAKRMKESKRG